MKKIYRITITIISLIGACIMGFQHDYLAMIILLALAIVFFMNRNQVGNKDE